MVERGKSVLPDLNVFQLAGDREADKFWGWGDVHFMGYRWRIRQLYFITLNAKIISHALFRYLLYIL